jgi:hypothetical protein
MARLLKALLLVSLAVVLGAGIWLYFRLKLPPPPDQSEINPFVHLVREEAPPPPGEPPPIHWLEPDMSCREMQDFLAADFKIVKRVNELPAGVSRLYTVAGQKQVAIANPGEKFVAGCVISDPLLPRRRLFFAGVAQDRAFIHYEAGGIARFIRVEFFRLKSPDTAVGLWSGYCDPPARSLDDLRRRMSCK